MSEPSEAFMAARTWHLYFERENMRKPHDHFSNCKEDRCVRVRSAVAALEAERDSLLTAFKGLSKDKKGRGRESEKDSLQPAEVSSKSSSAANAPARQHAKFGAYGQCSDEAPICYGCFQHLDALEAELRDAQIDAAKERSLSEVHLRRKRALEAENQQLKGQWPPDYNGLRTRAEQAETERDQEERFKWDANLRAEKAEGFLRMLSEGAHRSKYCICVAHEHLRALAWGKP